MIISQKKNISPAIVFRIPTDPLQFETSSHFHQQQKIQLDNLKYKVILPAMENYSLKV